MTEFEALKIKEYDVSREMVLIDFGQEKSFLDEECENRSNEDIESSFHLVGLAKKPNDVCLEQIYLDDNSFNHSQEELILDEKKEMLLEGVEEIQSPRTLYEKECEKMFNENNQKYFIKKKNKFDKLMTYQDGYPFLALRKKLLFFKKYLNLSTTIFNNL